MDMRTWVAGAIMLPLLTSMIFISTTVNDLSTMDPHDSASATHAEQLAVFVDQSVAELATADPVFADWLTATYDIHPLGPGTSAWLVLIAQNDQPLGYLIVGSDHNESFKLVEYGVGAFPLFSTNTLHRELMRSGLISSSKDSSAPIDLAMLRNELDRVELIYNDPFEALWEVEQSGITYWFDGITAQPLALDENPASLSRWQQALNVAPKTMTSAQQVERQAPFDPYEHFNWLVSEPLAMEQTHLKMFLAEHKRLVFLTSILNDIKAPYAVTGYQHWGQETLFVQIEHDGERFIPWVLLQQIGDFYPDM